MAKHFHEALESFRRSEEKPTFESDEERVQFMEQMDKYGEELQDNEDNIREEMRFLETFEIAVAD